MHTQAFFTNAEVAAMVSEPASKLRTWVARGHVVPQHPARWTPGEMLALGIFAELVRENLDYGEAAKLAMGLMTLLVQGRPDQARAAIVVTAQFSDGQAAAVPCYSHDAADALVADLMKRQPLWLRTRDFSDLFTRVKQARADGVVDVGGIAAMQDRDGAGHG